MTFLQPWWWLLAPLLWGWVLFLHSRRQRTLVVPSLMAWEAAAVRGEGGARRSWPRRSPPLLLQLLALTATVAMLAEPRVAGDAPPLRWAVWVATPAGADALRGLAGARGDLEAAERVSLWDLRGGVRPLVDAGVGATAAVFAAGVEDHEGRVAWAAAAQRLRDEPFDALLVLAPPGAGGLVAEALAAAEVDLPWRLVDVGPPAPAWAIPALSLRAHPSGWVASVQVAAAEPLSAPTELRLLDAQGVVASALLPAVAAPFQWATLPLPAAPTGDLRLQWRDPALDRLLAQAELPLPTAAPLQVGVVGRAWGGLAALAASSAVELLPLSVPPADPSALDLTLFVGEPPPEGFPGHLLHVGAGRPLEREDPAAGIVTVVWNAHPVLLPGNLGHELQTTGLRSVALRPGGEALAWAEGIPVVQVSLEDGFARVEVALNPAVAAPFLADDAFAVLLRSLWRWLDPQLAGAPACVVGAPCPLPRRSEGTLASPSGAPIVVPGAARNLWEAPFYPTTSGLHTFTGGAGVWRIWVHAAAPHGVTAAVAGDPASAPPLTRTDDGLRLMIPFALGLALLSLGRPSVAPSGGRRWRTWALYAGVALLGSVAVVGGPWWRGWVRPLTAVVFAPGEGWAEEPLSEAWLAQAAQAGAAIAIVGGDADASAPHRSVATVAEGLAWAAARLAATGAGRTLLVTSGGGAAEGLVAGLARSETLGDLTLARWPRFAPSRPAAVRGVHVAGGSTAGATARIGLELEAPQARTLQFSIAADGEAWWSEGVEVPAGRSSLAVDVAVGEATRYDFALTAPGFRPLEAAAILPPSRPLRVAVLADGVAWGLLLVQSLQVHGIEAEILAPTSAPLVEAGYFDYDTVVLLDLPAISLLTVQQQALEGWVRAGGGLVILGGERAFGPGGYHLTPLDTLSPLASEIPMDRPDVAIVFVLDRSGSMLQGVGVSNRLEIAREATWEAISLLDVRSQVGIVVFDSTSTLIHPVREIRDMDSIRRSLDLLTAGGGTALLPALEQAYYALQWSSDVQRQVIVMTDGLTVAADFDPIIRSFVEDGIPVSTLAIGRGAAYPRLRQIAAETGGRFHETVDFELLPAIMAQEVLTLTTDTVRRERSDFLGSVAPAPFLAGFDDPWPQVGGWVRTTAKPGIDLHAQSETGEPLLASWRFGVGRSIALATDGFGPWTLPWLAEPEFPRLWAQVVRWAGAFAPRRGFELTLRPASGWLAIDVVATDADGGPAASLPLFARVGGGAVSLERQVQLHEVAPGRYRGAVEGLPAGTYRVEVASAALHVGALAVPAAAEVVVPAILWGGGVPWPVLGGIVDDLGGRVVEAAALDLTPLPAAWRWEIGRAWRPYAIAALLLVVLALSQRYLRPEGALAA
jgi:uncharacterized membrane protein